MCSVSLPLSSDETTTIAQMRALVQRFVDERQWQKFHSPKNLSMALAIEAAELMEHFQWLERDASYAIVDDPAKLAQAADELADVVAYGCALANALQIDLSNAIRAKMLKNEEKYPADAYRGRYEKPERT